MSNIFKEHSALYFLIAEKNTGAVFNMIYAKLKAATRKEYDYELDSDAFFAISS